MIRAACLRIGLDVVSVPRWERLSSERRRFVLGQSADLDTVTASLEQFVLTESVIKCLGSSILLENPRNIRRCPDGLVVAGSTGERAAQLGLSRWHAATAEHGDAMVGIVIGGRAP